MQEQRIAAGPDETVAAITLSVSEIEEVAARMQARNDAAINAIEDGLVALNGAIGRIGGLIRRLDEAAIAHIQGMR
jgi:hypothetical protein